MAKYVDNRVDSDFMMHRLEALESNDYDSLTEDEQNEYDWLLDWSFDYSEYLSEIGLLEEQYNKLFR